ncbi:hypothetical protein NC651_033343 [Populus alba x Populus x berolinensis]|nr:hypothetical protein NC651_033343 [Populus alba x Populus x berolinensis]
MAGIADHWKAFSGFNNRDGVLIHPINTDFRRYLIHYGEKVGAIGDGFNNVKASNSFALSRYPPEELFSHVRLQNGNPFKYQVTKYFYLKLDDFAHFMEFDIKESAWTGYVAVTTDEGNMVLGRRDILVCWRGTILASEWAKNLQFDLVSAAEIVGGAHNPKMHHGFHSVYLAKSSSSKYNKNSAREQVLAEVRRLVDKNAHNGEDVSITVAGHSLEVKSYQGKLGEFRLVIDRDIALVNKSADVLPEKYKVPPNWRTVMNKGMIQMDDGFWKLNDYVPDPPSEDDIEGNITAIFLKDNMPPAL